MTNKIPVTVSERAGRLHVSTGSAWEPKIGYSRAVRAGGIIYVTGTIGIQADGSFAPDLKSQTRRAMEIVAAAIEALGGKVADVVRTRAYLTDITQWEEFGEIHGEIFGEVRPALTLVQVARLIDDAALVEIEAEAYIGFDPQESRVA